MCYHIGIDVYCEDTFSFVVQLEIQWQEFSFQNHHYPK